MLFLGSAPLERGNSLSSAGGTFSGPSRQDGHGSCGRRLGRVELNGQHGGRPGCEAGEPTCVLQREDCKFF